MMKNILLITLGIIFSSSQAFCQEPSQEMKTAKEKRTYSTAGKESKPVKNSFKNNNNNKEVKVISREKFKSYPVEKRQAILNNPEKYVIED